MKPFNKKFNFFLLMIFAMSLLLFTALSCDTTEPIEDNTQPGRRDYVWTVDTLNYPFNTIFKLWGSSPFDIWATSDEDWDKSISHFDGESWSSFGIQGIIDPFAVFGFSSNNVFVGAENGKIWRFNGSGWIEEANLIKDGHKNIIFEDIWGESTDDIYAFGAYPEYTGAYNNTVIAHYTGSEWEMINTDGLRGIVGSLFKNKSDNKIYLQVIEIGGADHFDSTHIYEYSNGIYNELYTSVWTKGKQANIQNINGDVYFILGNRIAVRGYNHFYTVLSVENSNFYQRIWGRSSKDLFLFMTDGLVHYNGADMEYLQHFDKPRTIIFDAMLFEKEVFFLVYESETNLNLIYHGKIE
ncbi:MAG: hypothetical protein K9J16_09645 [Melioribacteraceae bacterium]|nr:hypothetical protein [Melioribacteraceae bacterium]MCF8354889.1 hypothetical protein [Melioribacteraceae bacterium]MCF8393889.1 hypothetical protein [Melioribacteraceae bacterium]MCF8419661.1 hypothetical protein [Melioribacteraceae bacterium]